MKNKKLLPACCILFLCFQIFNFSTDWRNMDNIDLSMKNMNALYASADEFGCAPTSNKWCTIIISNIVIEGVGEPYYNY